MDKIEIPLSKTKIALLVAASAIFVALGVVFTATPSTFLSPVTPSPGVVRVVGILSALFFGFAGAYGVKKLLDKTIGLTVDARGITDNTNASSVGLVSWEDITEIKTGQIMSNKFLLIYTANPEKYIARKAGFYKKIVMGNMKMYGTPITITSSTLKCSFAELEKHISSQFMAQQKMAGRNRKFSSQKTNQLQR